MSSKCHTMSSECHSMTADCHFMSWFRISLLVVGCPPLCITTAHIHVNMYTEYSKIASTFACVYRFPIPLLCGGYVLPVVHPSCLCGNSLQVSLLWKDTGKEGKTCPCSVSANCPALVPHWADSHTALVWLLHCTVPKHTLSAK